MIETALPFCVFKGYHSLGDLRATFFEFAEALDYAREHHIKDGGHYWVVPAETLSED